MSLILFIGNKSVNHTYLPVIDAVWKKMLHLVFFLTTYINVQIC